METKDRKRARRAARGRTRIEAWTDAALRAVSAIGYVAAFLTLDRLIDAPEHRLVWVTCALSILVIPHFQPTLEGRRSDPRVRHLAELGSLLLQVALCVGLGALDTSALLPGFFLLVHSWLVARSSADGVAALSVVLGTLLVITALVVARGFVSLVLLPVQLFAALSALVLLHARASRGRVERATFRIEVPDETREALRRRLSYAALLSLFVGIVTVLLHGVTTQGSHPPPGYVDRPLADRGGEGDPTGPGGGEGAEVGADLSTEYPSGLDYGGSLDPLREDRLMEVRVRPAGRDWGEVPTAILLKGLNLDTFTDAGIELGPTGGLEPAFDADDGAVDGWIRLSEETGDEHRIELRHLPMRFGNTGETPLFRVEPLAAISLREVHHHPAGVLTTPVPVEGLLRYEVRTPSRDLSGGALHRARAEHPDERYTQLPGPSDDLAWLSERAREITDEATTDYERVERVVQHFYRGYAYSFEGSGFQGLRSLVDFMERREGFCTYFASAATLLLRCVDVPCRVATGFHVREWSEEEALYVVRARDAHAWFEVWFEGVGWVAFDGTPSDAVDEAVEEMFGAEDPGLAGWWEELSQSVADWGSDSGGADFREVVDAMAGLPQALSTSIRRNPKLLWGLALFTVPLLAWILRRRLGGALERVGVRPPGESRSDFYYHRLLRALARHGHVKRRSQTPREFARQVEESAGEELRPLGEVTTLLYRDRFGGLALSTDEARSIEEFIRELRASASRAPAGGGALE